MRSFIGVLTSTAICVLLSGSAAGFVPTNRLTAGSVVRGGVSWATPSTALQMAADDDDERGQKSFLNGFANGGNLPIGSAILGLIAVKSLFDLSTEVPNLFSGQGVNYIGTALDVFFVGYAAKTLLQQSGAGGAVGGPAPVVASLGGLRCRLTLNVGRERGTWMGADWGASGARLFLGPIDVRFSEEELDLGFPGEEALGGRFCRRLDVPDGTVRFVGTGGEVAVEVSGGGWATMPIDGPGGIGGASKLRFFLDFPGGAGPRNDVTLPAGRVYFSGVVFEDADAASLRPNEKVIDGPGGISLLTEGSLTLKKNGPINLYGALGDTNLILGRYSVSAERN